MQWARVLLKCLGKDGSENHDWAQSFVDFIQTPSPALNNDIYRDVFIRRYFERLSEGLPLAECPVPQKECWSVGSMGGVIPGLMTALSFANSPEISMEDMVARSIEIHRKTHNSENVSEAVTILAPLVVKLCRMPKREQKSEYSGDPSESSLVPEAIDPRRMLILDAAKSFPLPAVTGASLLRRYNKARGPGNIPNDEMYKLHTKRREGVVFDPSLYMDVPDSNVIGRKGFLGTVCYTEHGVPAILYLAYKYFEDPAKALKINANLLGDSTSRGSLLGCVLGAAHGTEWCQELISGLRQKDEFRHDIERFSEEVVSK
ncbi:unnamed protein product [Cylindrotheca closterium]|nr:unnamed protein product [Cylindrotheca closterium]